MKAILIIIGIMVSVLLCFDPPELFKIIVDTVTMILVAFGIILYAIIYIAHLRKTRKENNLYEK